MGRTRLSMFAAASIAAAIACSAAPAYAALPGGHDSALILQCQKTTGRGRPTCDDPVPPPQPPVGPPECGKRTPANLWGLITNPQCAKTTR